MSSRTLLSRTLVKSSQVAFSRTYTNSNPKSSRTKVTMTRENE